MTGPLPPPTTSVIFCRETMKDATVSGKQGDDRVDEGDGGGAFYETCLGEADRRHRCKESYLLKKKSPQNGRNTF